MSQDFQARRYQSALTNTRTRRIASYLRCSSDDQAHGDFTTLDTQRALNLTHIQSLDAEAAGEYADEGRTGTNLKRPGFDALLKDARAKRFDSVCVTSMSRLARGEAYHVAEYLLKEAGVAVVQVKENFTQDLAGHVNKQFTILMDGMCPKMVKQGYHAGGFPAFGYMKEEVPGASNGAGKPLPKRLVPDPALLPIVSEAYKLFLLTRTISRVRDYLNSVTDRKWTTETTKNLLTNEVYCGVQQFGQWRNEHSHAPMVDRETWDAVQGIMQERALKSSALQSLASRTTDDYMFYLKGLVFCPHCHCPCTQSARHGRTSKVRYYVCQTANRCQRRTAMRRAAPLGLSTPTACTL